MTNGCEVTQEVKVVQRWSEHTSELGYLLGSIVYVARYVFNSLYHGKELLEVKSIVDKVAEIHIHDRPQVSQALRWIAKFE